MLRLPDRIHLVKPVHRPFALLRRHRAFHRDIEAPRGGIDADRPQIVMPSAGPFIERVPGAAMEPVRSGIHRHTRRQLISARAPADPVRGVKECHLGPRDGLASRDELVDAFPNGDGSGQAGNAGADDDNMRTHGRGF